jgi:signal peptidase II
MARHRNSVVFVSTALFILALDQVSKAAVRAWLAPGERWPGPDNLLSHVFTFTHVNNTGIAFGMFRGNSNLLLLVSLCVVIGLLAYRRQTPQDALWPHVALGLVVAGAIGNAIDRLHQGHVTDFLDFQVWPVFNVADTCIFLGVVLLGWHMWRDERARAESATAPTPAP